MTSGSDQLPVVAAVDRAHYGVIRESVSRLTQRAARVANALPSARVLDVAPQDHGGIRPFLQATARLVTLDIDPASTATLIGDICRPLPSLLDASFDVVVCTEVLEHVDDPFGAVAQIHRVLEPGGWLFASAPFDFRIHGPLPDNWRFTEYGWRSLLRAFSEVDVEAEENPDRFLMPIHYRVIARR